MPNYVPVCERIGFGYNPTSALVGEKIRFLRVFMPYPFVDEVMSYFNLYLTCYYLTPKQKLAMSFGYQL
jgi:hypothetical protein